MGTVHHPFEMTAPVAQEPRAPLDLTLRPAQTHCSPRVVRVFTDRHDALVEQTRDGDDYLPLCADHQWLGTPVVNLLLLPECPFCATARDALAGRKRYAALMREIEAGDVRLGVAG